MAIQKRVRKSPDARREEILGEALRLIGQRGFNGSTIRELSVACGLSQAGMLHHFASKNDVLKGVLDHLQVAQAEALSPLIAACHRKVEQGRPALAAFRRLLRGMMVRNVENPEVARFVVVVQAEAVDPDHPAHEQFRRLDRQALEFYQQVLQSEVDEPEAIARGLHAAMFGITQQWLRESGAFDPVDRWMTVVSKLLPGDDD